MRCNECTKNCRFKGDDVLNNPCVYCEHEAEFSVSKVCRKCIDEECKFKEVKKYETCSVL